LDTAAFSAARACWVLGLDRLGRDVHAPQISLYLGQGKESCLDVVGRVLGAARGIGWISSAGLYTLRCWTPERLEGALTLTDAELLGAEDERDADGAVTAATGRYLYDAANGEGLQVYVTESADYLAARGLAAHRTEDEELPFSRRDDVRLWAGFEVRSRGEPARVIDAETTSVAALAEPGDVLVLDSAARGISEPVEVIEIRFDPSEGRVDLRCTDRRGFGSAPGFWCEESLAFPSRLGGATVNAWSAAWTDAQATWACQNLGFWADDYDFLDPTDARTWRWSVCV
jgi:hypothetical protein